MADPPTFPRLLHEIDESERGAVDYLKANNALDIPAKHFVDDCIQSYFSYVHPFLPVIDKSAFLCAYNGWNPSQQLLPIGVSLFLLQSMVFAGSCLLYDFDYEPHRLTVLQGVLLMANYYDSFDDRKNTWHWVGVAIDLAQTLGLYRNPVQRPGLSDRQRRIHKIIWWCCVVRDRFASLGIGRPLRILSRFTDVPALTSDDFGHEESQSQVDRDLESMFIALVDLCSVGESACTMHLSMTRPKASPAEVADCEARLREWFERLPVAAGSQPVMSGCNSSVSQIVLHRNILLQVYQIFLSTVHQPHLLRTEDPSPGLHEMRQLSRRRLKQTVCDITQLAAELVNLDLVKYCPMTKAIAILPTLAVHFNELKSAKTQDSRRVHMNRFNMCLMVLYGLRDMYWIPDRYIPSFEVAIDRVLAVGRTSLYTRHAEGSGLGLEPEALHLQTANPTSSHLETSLAPSAIVVAERAWSESGKSKARDEDRTPFSTTLLPRPDFELGSGLEEEQWGFDEWLRQFQVDDIDPDSLYSSREEGVSSAN
ncbi:hypothetical protein CNMCM6805_002871 [Aspergillus fumigatiaffinis]|uniref:Xylanolytic transcriptional activator regulatory domain-containing protein n=1 Tax=Aspergillus fumigatiaffinis TaxID=340414 RepID=A0A8H4M434_9EURO|nr:hypothetical protein CNMCM6805_002871 [Aspergillus fumigatiaffinis]